MSVQFGWISAKTICCPQLPETDWGEIILWPNLCYEFPLWLICQREIQPLGRREHSEGDTSLLHHPTLFHPLPPSSWRLHQQLFIIHKKSFQPNINSIHLCKRVQSTTAKCNAHLHYSFECSVESRVNWLWPCSVLNLQTNYAGALWYFFCFVLFFTR